MKKNKKKIKVLLSAYAVKPFSGSEPGVGWNFFKELSMISSLDVYLITEIEFKRLILEQSEKLGLKTQNIFFEDIGEKARIMCWNQGDWRFYYHYRKWQLKVKKKVIELNNKYNFDIVHHLNMIGFREPGFLNKIPNTKFVLGPLGGFKNAKVSFLYEMYGFKVAMLEYVKSVLNFLNLFLPRIATTIKNADFLLAAYPEGKDDLKKKLKVSCQLFPESGAYPFDTESTIKPKARPIQPFFLFIAKNVPRKGLKLAIESFKQSGVKKSHQLLILGEDVLGDIPDYYKKNNEENIRHLGHLPREEVLELIKQSKALLFTSLHEGTPHSVVETLTFGGEVICFESFGHGYIGKGFARFISINQNYKSCINKFADEIKKVSQLDIDYTKRLKRSSEFLKTNSWQKKAQNLFEIYKSLNN